MTDTTTTHSSKDIIIRLDDIDMTLARLSDALGSVFEVVRLINDKKLNKVRTELCTLKMQLELLRR